MFIARVSLFGACRMVLFGFAGHELRKSPVQAQLTSSPRGASDSDRAVLASTLHTRTAVVHAREQLGCIEGSARTVALGVEASV